MTEGFFLLAGSLWAAVAGRCAKDRHLSFACIYAYFAVAHLAAAFLYATEVLPR